MFLEAFITIMPDSKLNSPWIFKTLFQHNPLWSVIHPSSWSRYRLHRHAIRGAHARARCHLHVSIRHAPQTQGTLWCYLTIQLRVRCPLYCFNGFFKVTVGKNMPFKDFSLWMRVQVILGPHGAFLNGQSNRWIPPRMQGICDPRWDFN